MFSVFNQWFSLHQTFTRCILCKNLLKQNWFRLVTHLLFHCISQRHFFSRFTLVFAQLRQAWDRFGELGTIVCICHQFCMCQYHVPWIKWAVGSACGPFEATMVAQIFYLTRTDGPGRSFSIRPLRSAGSWVLSLWIQPGLPRLWE